MVIKLNNSDLSKQVKICSICKEEKPLTEFYIYYDKRMKKKYHNSRCMECISEYQNTSRIKKIKEKHRQTKIYKENQEKWKNKRSKDIFYRVMNSFRTLIRRALNGKKRIISYDIYLGCTCEFYFKYLEKQFIKGMTWENYGRLGWVVDHKKPRNLFDFSKANELLECFNFRNAQPLWNKDNIVKGNKYNEG